jgi:hypothetical protein
MEIITDAIPLARLREMAESRFGDMVKAVVDVEKGIMALDGELHADVAELLLARGSEQASLWGINIYPDASLGDWIEFDSLINLPPSQCSLSQRVEEQALRQRIVKIVSRLVTR